MTGLRRRRRDPQLPALAGQPELCAPDVREVEERVRAQLHREHAPAITGVDWEYARWKPAVSLTCSYRVRFEDGEDRIVSLKTFTDGKAQDLDGRVRVDPSIDERCDRLRPFHVDVDRGCALWSFPFDRVLRGQSAFLDRRFLARTIEAAGVESPRSVRRRRTSWELLRYKPERRAVWKVDYSVRGPRAARRKLVGRLLPAATARRAFQARWALCASEPPFLTPRPVVTDTPSGIVLEEWLDVVTFPPSSFGHAEQAGAALGRLHRHALPKDVPLVAPGNGQDQEDLFVVDAELLQRFRGLRIPTFEGPLTWTHGDFHPDQVARERRTGRWRLLDLDLLGPGDPVRDLASWIADELLEGGAVSPTGAAAELLEGYRSAGCPPVNRGRLWACVSRQLISRAAATIRRLEHRALDKATRALDWAQELAPKGEVAR